MITEQRKGEIFDELVSDEETLFRKEVQRAVAQLKEAGVTDFTKYRAQWVKIDGK